MKNFGADALFFVPEYLGNVNALGAAIVGIGMGVFFMSLEYYHVYFTQ
jgi:CTP-dependent riboflavin kinase